MTQPQFLFYFILLLMEALVDYASVKLKFAKRKKKLNKMLQIVARKRVREREKGE